MNIILFSPEEDITTLNADDVRYQHIKNILKLKAGDTFEGGIINSSYEKFTIQEIDDQKIKMSHETLPKKVESEYPISVFCSIIRPIDAKKVFKNLCTIGAEHIYLGKTDKTEKSYSNGNLWSKDKYYPLLVEGAQQGATPYIPEVTVHYSLDTFLEKNADKFQNKIALDNYQYTIPLQKAPLAAGKTIMAVGGERGWSDRERKLLLDYGFTLCSMGSRVLRTEAACLCGFAVLASRWW
ncbi:MAG: RsmE family RNA methyltransferase [Spirochaetia bacterium]|nr:RsmE family RNA methyltransferase [Spirochaetia bacterium]